MIVPHSTGDRLTGCYRGKVLKHLPHGRCKIYIPGVHPAEWESQPNIIPAAEQASPIFGGANAGNGVFSYPNIGATVLCMFMNGDQNYPVYFAVTLGGENAFGQYELVMPPRYNEMSALSDIIDLDVRSDKHLVTAGKTQVELYENGILSAYVSDPIRTDASVDYGNTYQVQQIDDHVLDRPICKLTDDWELSDVNCQHVMNVNSRNGSISFTTHHYDSREESIVEPSALLPSLSEVSGVILSGGKPSVPLKRTTTDTEMALTCDTYRSHDNGASIRDGIISSFEGGVKTRVQDLSAMKMTNTSFSESRYAHNMAESNVRLQNTVQKYSSTDQQSSYNMLDLSTQAFYTESHDDQEELCSNNDFVRDGGIHNTGLHDKTHEYSINKLTMLDMNPYLMHTSNGKFENGIEHFHIVDNGGTYIGAGVDKSYAAKGNVYEMQFHTPFNPKDPKIDKMLVSSDTLKVTHGPIDEQYINGTQHRSIPYDSKYSRRILRKLDYPKLIDYAQTYKENNSSCNMVNFDCYNGITAGIVGEYQLTNEITTFIPWQKPVPFPNNWIIQNTYKDEKYEAGVTDVIEDIAKNSVTSKNHLTSEIIKPDEQYLLRKVTKRDESGNAETDTEKNGNFGIANTYVDELTVQNGGSINTTYKKEDFIGNLDLAENYLSTGVQYALLTKQNGSVKQKIRNSAYMEADVEKKASVSLIARQSDETKSIKREFSYTSDTDENKIEILGNNLKENIRASITLDVGRSKITIKMLGGKTSTITIDGNGQVQIDAPAGITINGDTTINGKLDVTGDITGKKDVKASKCTLNTHKHMYIQPAHPGGSAQTETGQ